MTYLIPCGRRSRPRTSSCTPATGSTSALLDQFEARSRRLIGVYGNNDHGALRERLPEVARAEIEGVRIAVVHETGDKKGREERCAARFPDADVLVFGHSHIPWDTTAPAGLRLLNPGSPDRPPPAAARHLRHRGRRRTASCRDVTFHAVPPRGVSGAPPLDAAGGRGCWPARSAAAALAGRTPAGCAAPPGHRVRPGPPGPRHPAAAGAPRRRRATRRRWSPTGSAFLERRPLRRRHPRRWPTPCAASRPPATLLDLGGGTGHHLAGVLDGLPDAVGVVLDSSPLRGPAGRPRPSAGGRRGRRHLGAAARCADARRRPGARRVRAAQRPGDRPGAAPGRPARRRHPGRRPPRRAGRAARAAPGRPGQGRPAGGRPWSRTCEPVGTAVHRERLSLDRAAVATLVGMGPHARHLARDDVRTALAGLPEPLDVTVSVQIATYGTAP